MLSCESYASSVGGHLPMWAEIRNGGGTQYNQYLGYGKKAPSLVTYVTVYGDGKHGSKTCQLNR